MNYNLINLENPSVFRYFEEICQIPRGSKDMKRISDYCVSFAQKHNLEYYRDDAYNVIIYKDATDGYEDTPTVILQGHLDMVCEKNEVTEHDFTKDPIELIVEGDLLYANGTTLGADNGVAIAYALAILESDTISHPRLEVVFTVDEEIGMDGAHALDTTKLQGKYILNLDSNDEGIFLAGCAGGMKVNCILPFETTKQTGIYCDIKISGLTGGHSGCEIDKYRGNSICLLGRLLNDLDPLISFDIIDVKGGLKDNAIPRESFAKIIVQQDKIPLLKDKVKEFYEIYKKELSQTDSDFEINCNIHDEICDNVLTSDSKKKLLFLFMSIPNGVQKMSPYIEGLVESSLNIGILYTDSQKVEMVFSIRSSVTSFKEHLSNKLYSLISFLGGEYFVSGSYPEWEYKEESKLRNLMVRIFEKRYGNSPDIEIIHAGLECGILSSKIKDSDIISFGPDIWDIHTPNEHLSISSVESVYLYLIEILREFNGVLQ